MADFSRRSFLGGLAVLPVIPLVKITRQPERQPFNACKLWIHVANNAHGYNETFFKDLNALGRCGIKKYKVVPRIDNWAAYSEYKLADEAQVFLLRSLGDYMRTRRDDDDPTNLLRFFNNCDPQDPQRRRLYDRDAWFAGLLRRANMLQPEV